MRKIGVDLGFDKTKVSTLDMESSFDSVVGTDFQSMVSVQGDGITFDDPAAFVVGENALRYARFPIHAKDEGWIRSEAFYWLFLAALSEVIPADDDAAVVAGLPISTYYEAREGVETGLTGVHTFKRSGRPKQTIKVTCQAFPQAFGVACDEMLDDAGGIASEFAGRTVGILDIGGKTTNILWLEKFRDVSSKTSCLNLGCWNIIETITAAIKARTGRTLPEYQAREVLRTGKLSHNGKALDFQTEATAAAASVLTPLLTAIKSLWPDVAALDRIYLSGGGVYYLGKELINLFPQAVQARNPIFANARGFAKYGRGFCQ
jgi:hypothetical protein